MAGLAASAAYTTAKVGCMTIQDSCLSDSTAEVLRAPLRLPTRALVARCVRRRVHTT